MPSQDISNNNLNSPGVITVYLSKEEGDDGILNFHHVQTTTSGNDKIKESIGRVFFSS